MRFTRSIRSLRAALAGALLGAAAMTLVAVAAPAAAQSAVQWIKGGGFAGSVSEAKFAYTHNDGGKLAVETNRDLFKVPDDYGEPFAVTVANNQQIVWYRSNTLGVRNVIIESDRRLVHLLPRPNLLKSEAVETPAAR